MVVIRIQIVFHILSLGEIIQQMSMERVEMSEDKPMGHMGHSQVKEKECAREIKKDQPVKRHFQRVNREGIFRKRDCSTMSNVTD